MNAQTSAEKPEVSTEAPAKTHSGNGRTYVYTPGSLWSHLKFGLGTLAVIAIPPLIPGVTGNGLIMGYMGGLLAVFGVVCIWGVVQGLRSPGGHHAESRSRRHS